MNGSSQQLQEVIHLVLTFNIKILCVMKIPPSLSFAGVLSQNKKKWIHSKGPRVTYQLGDRKNLEVTWNTHTCMVCLCQEVAKQRWQSSNTETYLWKCFRYGFWRLCPTFQTYCKTLRFYSGEKSCLGPFMGWFCMLYHLEMSICSSDQYVREWYVSDNFGACIKRMLNSSMNVC